MREQRKPLLKLTVRQEMIQPEKYYNTYQLTMSNFCHPDSNSSTSLKESNMLK